MSEQARRTQRLGAYAVVVAPDADGREHLLLTRVSPRGYPAGSWALPGGGVDHGEPPGDALIRELHEETGLRVRLAELVEVHDVHVVEQGRADQYEDYHGVHLVYRTQVEGADSELPQPRVVEVDGTTDIAQWVPLDVLSDAGPDGGDLLPLVAHVLGRLAAYRITGSA